MSIRSCASSETEKLHQPGKSRRLGNIAKVALRKLDMLVAAAELTDMRVPPGNRLEELSGDRKGRLRLKSWTITKDESHDPHHHAPRRDSVGGVYGVVRPERHQACGALAVPANRITAIVNGSRGITADTALRSGRYFRTTPGFWLNLQQSYELLKARMETGAGIVERVPEMAA